MFNVEFFTGRSSGMGALPSLTNGGWSLHSGRAEAKRSRNRIGQSQLERHNKPWNLRSKLPQRLMHGYCLTTRSAHSVAFLLPLLLGALLMRDSTVSLDCQDFCSPFWHFLILLRLVLDDAHEGTAAERSPFYSLTVEQLVLPPVKLVHGTVTLPGSKSLSNRTLLLAALAEGTTHVKNLLVRQCRSCCS